MMTQTTEILESLLRQVIAAQESNNSGNEERDLYVIGYDMACKTMIRMIERRMEAVDRAEGR